MTHYGHCPTCNSGAGDGWHIDHQLCERCDWSEMERGMIAIAHKTTAWADVGYGKEHFDKSVEWRHGWKDACQYFSTQYRALTREIETGAAYRIKTTDAHPRRCGGGA